MNPQRPASVLTALLAALAGLVVEFLAFVGFFPFLIYGAIPVSSVVGASVVAVLSPRREPAAWIGFLLPGSLFFLALPSILGALTDGHPSPQTGMYMILLPLAHIVASVAMLELVPRIRSKMWRLLVPAIALAGGGVAAMALRQAQALHSDNLMQRSKASSATAFGTLILPSLLKSPPPITWRQPVPGEYGYTVDGDFPDGRGHIRLSASDPFNIAFTVTLKTSSDFQMGDQKDQAGRLKRAKAWLTDAGVGNELVGAVDSYSIDRWSTSFMVGKVPAYITPGGGSLKIEGLLSFDPESGRYRL